MSTISEKQYIRELVSELVISLRREGMPMVSASMALLAAAFVVLKHELGDKKALEVLKRSVDELPLETDITLKLVRLDPLTREESAELKKPGRT